MLYFLGNCQMDFLGRAVADLGPRTMQRELASPLTYSSHPGRVPAVLGRLVRDLNLADYFHGRVPENQFVLLAHGDEPPSLLAFNLFHENVPLFLHNDERFIFFLDPAAWRDNPALGAWLDAHCSRIAPNPATYLQRFGKFLAQVRERFPEVPLLVTTRLWHFPAFGPDPRSYLEGWAAMSPEAPAHFKVWERELGVRLLDTNRVFGGVWRGSDRRIEAHCPFLRIKLEEKDGMITGLHASRDVEHVGSLWPALAAKVAEFVKTGEIAYGPDETVPVEWNRPWQPSTLDEDAVIDRFATRHNYAWAEAVGSFFMDLTTDRSPLLAASGEFMPVCHNTLHMIKNYGRIHKNPLLARFCDDHRPTAEAFTDNGPVYQADYLARLDEIRAHALS